MKNMKKIVLFAVILLFAAAAVASAAPCIVARTQKYDGADIDNGGSAIEILGLKDDEKNAGADAFNKAVRSSVGKFYDDFLKGKEEYPDEPDWVVIRSYPFSGKNYLQVVTHYASYPNYGSDGNVASFVYDKKKKSLVTLAGVMKQYGIDGKELTRLVAKWYDDGYKEDKERVARAEPAGLYIWESKDSDASDVMIIVYVTIDVPGADEWTYLYTYSPRGDAEGWSKNPLQRLEPDRLFSPASVVKMNPPLLINKASD
ncbi:hypothetical protein FACS1894187_18890 [Synergistales bacterium]|nr:hypothetical protein FACS1894187_18890 [Synergistales bacterium]